MVIYFSGTGNSKYCADMIASELGDEIVDSFNYIKNGIAGEFISGKPWVFVAPTYCWQLPHIFEDFIKTSDFDGTSDAYFVMTCGSDIGNAEKYLKALCVQKNLNYKGVLEVVMPENYIAMFNAPDEEESARIVKAARRPLSRAIKQIEEGHILKGPKVTLNGKISSGPTNPIFYKLFVKAKAFYAKDTCTGCGLCSQVCPLNNIDIKNGKPVWGNNCTHCMACICKCPLEAIEYGNKSQGKPRYKCVEYIHEEQQL